MMEKSVRNRDANIELLRIIAMFFVISIHCISNGVILSAPNITIYNTILVRFLYACVTVANGVFLLITGYYLVDKKMNIKKILNLWGKTLFYSILIFAILSLIGLQTNFYASFFPVFTASYWFISAYIALYILSPALNIIVNKFSQKQLKYTIIVLLIFYGIIRIINEAPSTFQGALPPAIMLYLIGAYLKKYVAIKPKRTLFFKIFITSNLPTNYFWNVILVKITTNRSHFAIFSR